MDLFTIGYERASFDGVLGALHAAAVRLVIDVRDLPLSRRAGFSKRQLAAGLDAAGIGYAHLRPLGTPPEGRLAHRRREWGRFWEIVDTKLATGEAALALEQAAGLASERTACLLCFEADPAICHRCRVGEMLAGRHGFTVRHLRPVCDDPAAGS